MSPTKLMRHLGTWSELTACRRLLEQDWEVFRNIAPNGPIDLVAVRAVNGHIEIMLLAVKTGRPWYEELSVEQQALGVQTFVVKTTGECRIPEKSLIKRRRYALR